MKHPDPLLVTMAIHLLLASGGLSQEQACKAMNTDREALKRDRKLALRLANEMVQPLLKHR